MDISRVFIRQALHAFIPSSIIGYVACFVFYDHHPRDERRLDVIVCSNRGEVLEYYQRELISSLIINNINEVSEIRILRNSNCDLFYLIVAKDELVILSRKENLQLLNRVSNVESFAIEDLECKGQAYLKIIRNDDAVPLVFDENFVNLTEKRVELNNEIPEESSPIIMQLMRKLTEAKYVTKHNEKKYKEYVNLRQAAAFSIYEKTTFNLEDSFSKVGMSEVTNLLQVTAKPPVVKLCNKKVVIIISLQNNNNVQIRDVCVLLHTVSKLSIEHTTKVYENISKPPYWKERDVNISAYNESTIVAVVDLKELQYDIASRLEFDVALSYTKNGKNHLLPIESVSISSLDIMGENFDALLCGDIDSTYLALCIIATSECFELRLRHIKNPGDNAITLSEIFNNHLKMEKYFENVAIHKITPFHILYGVMVVFNDNIGSTDIMNIQVYTRFSSQILALINFMYDAVPYRIIATTSDYKLSAISDDLSSHNENSQTIDQEIDYTSCASSVIKQIKLTRDYLDDCMRSMNEDPNPEIQEKVGREVDLMAMGVKKFLEFRNQILEENVKGIKGISFRDNSSSESDCMIIN